MAVSWEELHLGLARGNVRALARLITRIENREAGWKDAMRRIYPRTGSAKVIGITGSPGTGKSTLTGRIALMLAERDFKVGIVAVDPSSPFSGGALLGDRIRMQEVFTNENIFIRSMATRGALGGLCQAAKDVTRVLDAFGKDIVIIETVGAGQDEIEVVRTADVVAVVCVPGQGDGIQALKAGVMEIGDIFVVNKADRDGADEVVGDIAAMLELAAEAGQPVAPIVKTSAIKSEGISALTDTLIALLESRAQNREKTEAQTRNEILTLVEHEILRSLRNEWDESGALDAAVRKVLSKESDPYSIMEEMLSRVTGYDPIESSEP